MSHCISHAIFHISLFIALMYFCLSSFIYLQNVDTTVIDQEKRVKKNRKKLSKVLLQMKRHVVSGSYPVLLSRVFVLLYPFSIFVL